MGEQRPIENQVRDAAADTAYPPEAFLFVLAGVYAALRQPHFLGSIFLALAVIVFYFLFVRTPDRP